jgi:hypothetical protein
VYNHTYIFKTMCLRNKGLILSRENLLYVHFFDIENFSASGMDKESLDSNQCVVVRQPNLSKLYDIQTPIYRDEKSLNCRPLAYRI